MARGEYHTVARRPARGRGARVIGSLRRIFVESTARRRGAFRAGSAGALRAGSNQCPALLAVRSGRRGAIHGAIEGGLAANSRCASGSLALHRLGQRRLAALSSESVLDAIPRAAPARDAALAERARIAARSGPGP